MIRKLERRDLDAVVNIWLQGNCEAHDFIEADYWQNYAVQLKEELMAAEVYVFEEDKQIKGFIGLEGNYIAGIFVCAKQRSHGIGSLLLEYVKKDRKQLSLHVYVQNKKAVQFYLNSGFQIQSEEMDPKVNEKEYLMTYFFNDN